VKVLIPVLPTERFYDAVVAGADLLADRGGTITFLFAGERPPPEENRSTEDELVVDVDSSGDVDAVGLWQQRMIDGLDEARQLLDERGIGESQVSYTFADFDTTAAQSIADEAAAGSYDVVILSRGEMVSLPDLPGEAPTEIAEAIEALREDGIRLMVT
jgi:hypothetical protein